MERDRVIRNWDTEEGLPAGNVSALARTPDGYLWIGTSSGLARYDGSRFRNSFAGTGGPKGGVSCLYTDPAGALWIGTQTGELLRFVDNRFVRIALDDGSPSAPITSLAQDFSGTIWGTRERAGLFAYREGGTQLPDFAAGLPSSMVWNITADSRGGLWVVSKWRLLHYEAGRWRQPPGLPPDLPRVCALTSSRQGGLWIACVGQSGPDAGDRGARIFRYRDGQVTEDRLPLPWSQDSRRSLARFLVEDRQGRLWCTTRGAGVFVRDPDRWRLVSEMPALAQSHATAILEDEDATVWLGIQGTGLYQLRPRLVCALTPQPGGAADCFWTVWAARDGSVWGGTDGNGIYCWKNNAITHFGREQGLTNDHVNAIIEDHNTNLWVGTLGGLFRFQNGRFESVTDTEQLRQPVFALEEDHAGRIWAGTQNGLVRISRNATKVFGSDQGVPYGPINGIEEDKSGRIWISVPPYRDWRYPGPVGPYGLFVQAGDRFVHVGEGQWAGEPNIRALHAGATGDIWIGTIGTGVYRCHEGKFTEYSVEDGLPHNRIQAIASDRDGNLWFCSEFGIFGCPIEQLKNYTRGRNARLDWWRLHRVDGLPNKSATGNGQPCAVSGPDGRIWLANGDAIAAFDPRVVTENARLRPPVIEEILVNGLRQIPVPGDGLRIRAETRRLEIHYSSPNTAAPDFPMFWTRLKGFDADWVNGGSARVASYNLLPGHYQFAVAVAGPDGARLETTAPLRIEVVPRFWERTSVRVLATLGSVAGIVLAVWTWERSRSRRRLRVLEIQRAMDQVRQRIARDIHDDLGSGLTEITLLSDNLREDLGASGDGEKTAERIATRARALTHEMDEVVWAINPRTDTLESLVTYLNDFAQEQLSLAGIRCRLHTSPELPNLDVSAEVRHNLYRAAKEAVNNAIKHATASEVTITIEPQNGQLLFVIQDNGRGFEPGHQLKRGNGLKNIRQRIREIGGRCEIRSRTGSGTSICLVIPTIRNGPFKPAANGDSAPVHE